MATKQNILFRSSAKLYLFLLLPLLIMSLIVLKVTNDGLSENSKILTHALAIDGNINRITSLLIQQDDATKAILLNPDELVEFSEAKISAYDEHLLLLKKIYTSSYSKKIKRIIQNLIMIDAKQLKPLDSSILEELFTNQSTAITRYFTEYKPIKEKYSKLVNQLKRVSKEHVQRATISMEQKNRSVITQVLLILCIASIIVAVTIHIMTSRMIRSADNNKKILDTLHEGLFFFDQNGLISDNRSKAVSVLLPGSQQIPSIDLFLAQYCSVNPKDIAECIKLLWHEDDDFFSDFDTIIRMLPKNIHLKLSNGGTKFLELEYKAIKDSHQNLKNILVVISDISETVKANVETRLMTERISRISLAVSNIEAYYNFFEEAIHLFKDSDHKFSKFSHHELPTLKHNLHTLKGILATFEYTGLATDIHQLESLLNDQSEDQKIQRQWDIVKDRWKFESSDIEETLNLNENHLRIQVDKHKLQILNNYVRKQNNKDLKRLVYLLQTNPIKDIFNIYENLIHQLSKKEPNKAVKLNFGSDSDELSFDDIKPIEGVLTHIFRNSFDHGILTTHERENLGKPGYGTIMVSAFIVNHEKIHLIIKDDGEGIDTNLLTEKAIQYGIWDLEQARFATEQDKLDLIFCPNLSTKNNVTEISGRGVGMDAVAETIRHLGGKITVYSEKGIGTQFEITIPFHSGTKAKSA